MLMSMLMSMNGYVYGFRQGWQGGSGGMSMGESENSIKWFAVLWSASLPVCLCACEWAPFYSFTSSTLPRQTPPGQSRAILASIASASTCKHQRRLFSCQPALRAVRKKHVGDYRLCPESNIATCACTGAADATCCRTRAKGHAQWRRGGVSEDGLLIRLFSPERLLLGNPC
ncbi:hypothetical protein J3F84DRAFT_362556, partial [Trichoderma pleuroticola]